MDIPCPAVACRQRAFSFIELITLIAVVSILLGIGIPGFNPLIRSSRISSVSADLMSHLQLARSEAIVRGMPVVLCPSPDGMECNGNAAWHEGILMYADREWDRRKQDEDPVIRRYRPPGDRISIRTSRWRRHLIFRPSGSAAGSAVTFTLCDSADAATARAVIVSNTGRARIDTTRPDGSLLHCG